MSPGQSATGRVPHRAVASQVPHRICQPGRCADDPPGSAPLQESPGMTSPRQQQLSDDELRTLDAILAKISGPGAELPPVLFRFVTEVAATSNIDLLVLDDRQRVLLAWRQDAFGAGWHVPGSIIRHREEIGHRIQACAMEEFGCDLAVAERPVALIQIFDDRGHSVSLCHTAALRGTPGQRVIPGNGDAAARRPVLVRCAAGHVVSQPPGLPGRHRGVAGRPARRRDRGVHPACRPPRRRAGVRLRGDQRYRAIGQADVRTRPGLTVTAGRSASRWPGTTRPARRRGSRTRSSGAKLFRSNPAMARAVGQHRGISGAGSSGRLACRLRHSNGSGQPTGLVPLHYIQGNGCVTILVCAQ